MLRNQSRQFGSDVRILTRVAFNTSAPISNSSMQADPVKQRTGDINVMSTNDMVKIA